MTCDTTWIKILFDTTIRVKYIGVYYTYIIKMDLWTLFLKLLISIYL